MRSCVLVVLDGFGESRHWQGNAVALARTPFLEQCRKHYPHTTLQASGGAVGLPDGQMGNSEVGHLTLGAGRVVLQDLPRISHAISSGDFFANKTLLQALRRAKVCGSTVHVMGLCSRGGVHSHTDHAIAIVRLCKQLDISEVAVHAFLDGRDTPPKAALEEIAYTEAQLSHIGVGRIASIVGRFYAMDRDHRFERTKVAYDLLIHQIGRPVDVGQGPQSAIREAYEKGASDEFITPIVMTEDGNPICPIRPNDCVIFFNFRADRARQLTSALTCRSFVGFDRGNTPPISFVAMTSYNESVDLPAIFPKQVIHGHFGEYLSMQGIRQLRIAETEKYAHVTFFFNGGREAPYPLEDRILIPSNTQVATYDEAPEMSANAITAAATSAISSQQYSFILINYANPDMVGHTGKLQAAISAVETIDRCLRTVWEACALTNTGLLITADHGNCETMIDPITFGPHTAHTNEPVPFFLIDREQQHLRLREGGGLKDVAPTLCALMGLQAPPEMTGASLCKIP